MSREETLLPKGFSPYPPGTLGPPGLAYIYQYRNIGKEQWDSMLGADDGGHGGGKPPRLLAPSDTRVIREMGETCRESLPFGCLGSPKGFANPSSGAPLKMGAPKPVFSRCVSPKSLYPTL